MNEKKRKATDNDILEKVLLEAGKFAKAFMKLPPLSSKELREKLKRNEKECS